MEGGSGADGGEEGATKGNGGGIGFEPNGFEPSGAQPGGFEPGGFGAAQGRCALGPRSLFPLVCRYARLLLPRRFPLLPRLVL